MPEDNKKKPADGKFVEQPELKEVALRHQGTEIILPSEPRKMTIPEGITWLKKIEQEEEKIVNIHRRFKCYPLDGLICLSLALKRQYGFTEAVTIKSFFGDTPPTIVSVRTGLHETTEVVFGPLAPPVWEGGMLQPNLSGSEPDFVVSGKVKRKFEPEVKKLLDAAEQIMKHESIYKGKAFKLDMTNFGTDHFNLETDAPEFMDVSGLTEKHLLVNDDVKFSLACNIWTLIEKTAACRANKIPLKHGCLLQGPFGTGKTLAAYVTAKKAVDNKWTFIYVKKSSQTAAALRFAAQYSPAVVFVEDVDQVTTGGRDESVNEIMNTLDGVDTKNSEIITILTTNEVEKIEVGMLRAGRIDTVIYMGPPDAKTAQEFVKLYAKTETGVSLLDPEIDLEACGLALANMVPAFISEAIQKAKRYAIYRTGSDDITGKVTSEDVTKAARLLKDHINMMERPNKISDEQILASSMRVVIGAIGNGNTEHLEGTDADIRMLGKVFQDKKLATGLSDPSAKPVGVSS